MKRTITLSLALLNLFIGLAQTVTEEAFISKNEKGIVSAVEFSDVMDKAKIPSSSNAFFEQYLKVTSNDEFEKAPHKSKRAALVHDHFDQFYKGIKVDGGGYNLHYKDGQMFFANGNFVKIDKINAIPSVSLEEAKASFLTYKSIEKETVVNTISELMIKEITAADDKNAISVPALVYRIYLESDHQNNDEVGFIDAHSGKVVMTGPRATDLVGTFATRYNSTELADTQPVTGGHRLFDNTRGAPIHTRSLQNNSTIFTNGVDLIDNNNNWTTAEHTANNNDMGLDVHWGLQEIYDYLHDTHDINSFNDAGQAINAFIRFGVDNIGRDGARWDPNANVLAFGQGVSTFKPLASLDVVAHEFGHGITDFQIGWGLTNFDQRAFNEGLSDIWGAILEQRIRPNNTWKIGEQITKNKPHTRNIQFTNDTNSLTKIADTFGSTQYNNTTDIYVRGGVFSHWFYILANGESGTNDLGTTYAVNGIGMTLAEELIVEAVFNNYLDATTTYAAIRTAMINAAQTIFCANSPEVRSVMDAWHAVGVGAKYTGTVVTVSGPAQLCTTGTFSVNAPAGTTTTWSISPSSAATFPAGAGASKIFTKNGTYTGSATVTANVTYTASGCTSTVSRAVAVGSAITLNAPNMPDPQGGMNVSVTGGTGNYKWYKNGTFLQTSSGPSLYLQFGCSGGLLKVTCNTSCGAAEATRTIYYNCESYLMAVYPNPSSSEIFIDYDERAQSENGGIDPSVTSENPIRTEIYDFSGNLVQTKQFEKSSNVPSMDISDLKKATYFLRIIGKEVDEVHQIIKQ